MKNVIIRDTPNPAILKFEFSDFIAGNNSHEFRNIDETARSPLARELFYLPFVKTVYISGNFIAIEKYNIVEWDDVKETIAEQIGEFVKIGGIIINEEPQAGTKPSDKKQPATVYGETTPNPAVLKFVVNRMLTKTAAEFKNIDETAASPLAAALFTFPYIKEVFIDENYVSVTKYSISDWSGITLEIRTFIKEFIENGGTVIDESLIAGKPETEAQKTADFDSLDVTSQQIVNILEEYVRPAVAADGGNIVFDSYDAADKRVKVILQGACSGCPSSTFTLKNGIENMLKDMLKDEDIKVEALNA